MRACGCGGSACNAHAAISNLHAVRMGLKVGSDAELELELDRATVEIREVAAQVESIAKDTKAIKALHDDLFGLVHQFDTVKKEAKSASKASVTDRLADSNKDGPAAAIKGLRKHI